MFGTSFVSRQIQVHVTLAHGAFGGVPDNNTKIIKNLRVHCEIKKAGAPAKNECKLKIYGMLDADMKLLSTLGYSPMVVRKNLVQVYAGDSDGLTSVYQGEISGAWINYHTPPDLYFELHCVEGLYAAVKPIYPTSVSGSVPATTLFKKLADEMGVVFQDGGVTAVVSSPYLFGSAYDQARDLANMIGCEFGLDGGKLFVSPRGKSRSGQAVVPLITPDTGLKEYPTWNKKGLVVEALFDPAFQLNGLVKVDGSMVENANGVWRIHGLHHSIAANTPHSTSWQSTLELVKEGS